MSSRVNLSNNEPKLSLPSKKKAVIVAEPSGTSIAQSTQWRRTQSRTERSARYTRATEALRELLNFDDSHIYANFSKRHRKDANYIKPLHNLYFEYSKYKPKEPRFIEKYPSYTKFKVPFPMICAERVDKNFKKYNRQFIKEMQCLIDNQSTASDATFFMRAISYTTLWPPYHNLHELEDTSRKFFRLSRREQNRFQNIMSNDFSYM